MLASDRPSDTIFELKKDISTPDRYMKAGIQKTNAEWEEIFPKAFIFNNSEWFIDMTPIEPFDYDAANGISPERRVMMNIVDEVFAKRLLLDAIAALKFLFTAGFMDFWAIYRAHMSLYYDLSKTKAKRRLLKHAPLHNVYRKNIVFESYLRYDRINLLFQRNSRHEYFQLCPYLSSFWDVPNGFLATKQSSDTKPPD